MNKRTKFTSLFVVSLFVSLCAVSTTYAQTFESVEAALLGHLRAAPNNTESVDQGKDLSTSQQIAEIEQEIKRLELESVATNRSNRNRNNFGFRGIQNDAFGFRGNSFGRFGVGSSRFGIGSSRFGINRFNSFNRGFSGSRFGFKSRGFGKFGRFSPH